MKKKLSIILILLLISLSVPNLSGRISAETSSKLYTEGSLIMYSGKALSLHGVNITELSWSSYGDGSSITGFSDADLAFNKAINDWNCNLIRIAVNPTFYLYGGTHKGITRTATEYQNMVDKFITTATNKGIVVVLDCHSYQAVTKNVVDFWKITAPKYNDNGLVMYGLLNEPYGNWSTYYEGGTITVDATKETENVIGMTELLDIVRSLSDNVVVIGGTDFAFELKCMTKEDLITLGKNREAYTGLSADEYANKYYLCREDRVGNGIVFDSHIYYIKYGRKEDAISKILGKYPILVGEYGPLESYGNDNNITLSQEESEYLSQIHTFISENHLSSTAWGMGAAPFLTMNNHSVTTPFGESVRSFVAINGSDRIINQSNPEYNSYSGNLLKDHYTSYKSIAEFPNGSIIEHQAFYNQAHKNGNKVGNDIIKYITDGDTENLYDIYEWYDHRMGVEFTLSDTFACYELNISSGYPGYPDKYKIFISDNKETLYKEENCIENLTTEHIGTVKYNIDRRVKYVAFLAQGYVRIHEIELKGTIVGDINKDGIINAKDLTELCNILLNINIPSGQNALSDINKDNKIDILDLIKAKKNLVQ